MLLFCPFNFGVLGSVELPLRVLKTSEFRKNSNLKLSELVPFDMHLSTCLGSANVLESEFSGSISNKSQSYVECIVVQVLI